MPFSNLQLMRDSRRDLAPQWGLGVLVAFVYVLIIGVPSSIFPDGEGIVSLVLAGPLAVGVAYFSFAVIRGETPHFFQLFEGFNVFGKSFLANLCYSLLVIVGFVLLIIPGIIVGLALSMTFFVMADRPELSFSECLNESWNLTSGYRFKLLGLNLRFIPWYLLGILCLGVGMLLVIPWYYISLARFYEELKVARRN
ncbi:MAG: DUF975 family protein [Flavobacteriaceae bacterium]|nr:DUF975 family protein [Flavobacteriaceae bacterium]